MLAQLINNLSSNPRNIFLVDGLGAMLSTFLLGVVLVKYEATFGMPREVLSYLASGAGVFMVYSLFCFFRNVKNWQPFLRAIALANILYCSVTLGLVFYLNEKLTALGILYFVVEIIIVVSLSIFELKTAGKEIGSLPPLGR